MDMEESFSMFSASSLRRLVGTIVDRDWAYRLLEETRVLLVLRSVTWDTRSPPWHTFQRHCPRRKYLTWILGNYSRQELGR
jgi:hypothetical protein